MDICNSPDGKALLLIAESRDDEKVLNDILIQRAQDKGYEIRRSRNLYPVIPGRLYHALSVEESGF
jgi:hypothetical protein